MGSNVSSNGEHGREVHDDNLAEGELRDLEALPGDNGDDGGNARTGRVGRGRGKKPRDDTSLAVEDAELYGLAKKAVKAVRLPYGLPGDPARKSRSKLMKLLTDRQYPKGHMRECPAMRVQATTTGFNIRIVDTTMSICFEGDCEHLEDILDTMTAVCNGKCGKVYSVRYGAGFQKLKAKQEKDLGKLDDAL